MPADIGSIAVYGVAPMKSMRPGRQSNFWPRTPQTILRMNRKAVLGILAGVAILICGVGVVEFTTADRVETAATEPAPPANTATGLVPASLSRPGGTVKASEAPSALKTGRLMPATSGEASVNPSVAAPYPDAQRFAQSGPAETRSVASSPPAVAVRHPATGTDERETASAAGAGVKAADGTPDDDVSSPQDGTATASIQPNSVQPDQKVQVAETDAEVARLEMSTGMVGDGVAVAPEGGPPLTTAHVTKYVNLRDGPADEAKVVAVIPANAEIEVETGCQWCLVVHNGQRGYIYKSFIKRNLKEEAREGTGLF